MSGIRALLTMALAVSALGSCTSAHVSDIYTAVDASGGRRRNEFLTDSSGVFCIAEVSSGRDDQTVEVLLRQIQDENAKAVDRVLAAAEGPTKKGVTGDRFIVQLLATNDKGEAASDLPVPQGRYRCEAKIDGADEGTVTFNVTYAPCPVSQIFKGKKCSGLVKPNASCPKFGTAGKDSTQCSCKPEGWDCQ
jgi:hypothetical protein